MNRASSIFFYHLLALAVVAVWGVTFVCTKTLIGAGMHPAAIFVVRFVLAYAGIWILTLAGGGRPRLMSDNWKDELMFLFLGVTGGSFYFLTENTALAYTQAANVAFLVCVAPVFTAIFTLIGKKLMRGRMRQQTFKNACGSLSRSGIQQIKNGPMSSLLLAYAVMQIHCRESTHFDDCLK